jgi:hypothetical protein
MISDNESDNYVHELLNRCSEISPAAGDWLGFTRGR